MKELVKGGHPFTLDWSFEKGEDPLIVWLPPTNEDGEWDEFTLEELNVQLTSGIQMILNLFAPGARLDGEVELIGMDW